MFFSKRVVLTNQIFTFICGQIYHFLTDSLVREASSAIRLYRHLKKNLDLSQWGRNEKEPWDYTGLGLNSGSAINYL